jgi:DNA-binding PadR family transcriptional regulator
MVENIANKFERAMKKGFVNIFTLILLGDEPTHGYQIKKLIEERTLGVWSPSDSTMYTILKDLRQKDLIKPIENQDPEDPRIIYELTKKGRDTLDLMLEKQKEMRESMTHILTSSGIKDFFTEDIKDLFPDNSFKLKGFKAPFPFLGDFQGDFIAMLNDKPISEQLRILNLQREFITQRVGNLTKRLKNIDEKISELESKEK